MRPVEPRSEWSRDLIKFRERLAERLRVQGAPHPEAGAAALVARGVRGHRRAEFAAAVGLSLDELHTIERGELADEDWPDALRRRVAASVAAQTVEDAANRGWSVCLEPPAELGVKADTTRAPVARPDRGDE